MKTFTWTEALHRRLSRNHLLEPAPRARLVEVVGAVGGVQAQVLTAAELALSARVAGLTQPEVRAELWERRRLVKTYGPRSTLHLLPADELPLWMAAMRALPYQQKRSWFESSGLKPAQATALFQAIREVLDGRSLTREALADEVGRRVGAWAKARLASTWADLVGPAACAGVLCFGPSQGARVTFVRPDQWLGGWKEREPEEALREVFRRYLAAYGPATPADFARWFAPKGMRPAEARRLAESLAQELEPVDVEGRRAFRLASEAEMDGEPGIGSLRLLPKYDCYLLGSYPREQIVPEAARARLRAHPRGRFEGAVGHSVLLIDGVVAGMWEQRDQGKRVELRVEPFSPLTTRQRRQLEAEAARVGRFLETETTLSIGSLL